MSNTIKSDREIATEVSTLIGAIVASCGDRRQIETEEEAKAVLHSLDENGQKMRKILRGEDSWGLGKTDYEEAREQLGLSESYDGDIYWWVEDGMNTNYICFDC